MKILFLSFEPSDALVKAVRGIGHDIRAFKPRDVSEMVPHLLEIKWIPDVVHCKGEQCASFVQIIRKARQEGSFLRTATVGQDDNADIPDDGSIVGIDYEIWNPATDPGLYKRYNRNTLSLRSQNKKPLQAELKLSQDENIPLIAAFSNSIPEEKEIRRLDCQFVLLDAERRTSPVYAGADILLDTTITESLIGYRYGAVPIVKKQDKIAEAVKLYKNRSAWKKMQETGMGCDHSWEAAAKKYIALYVKALNKII